MKLEKYKNIREESAFFYGEISEGTLKFDRKEAEVCTLVCLRVLFLRTQDNSMMAGCCTEGAQEGRVGRLLQ
jgi:hypothetical protein